MSTPLHSAGPALASTAPGPDDRRADAATVPEVEEAIQSFTQVLTELRSSHARLEARARHVEAELCQTNDELARKIVELDRVKQNLEAVLTSIPAGVVVYDSSGRVQRANDAALSILGVEREALIGQIDLAELAGSEVDGQPTEVRCSDGEVRVLARKCSYIRLEDGVDGGLVEIIEDQTALVRARERIHRLDKSAALGTMAGGIAHEIRNPLHAVQGFADLLVRETEDSTRAAGFASRIREGAREIDSIVASMLGLAGDHRLYCEPFDPTRVARHAVETALAERAEPSRWFVAVDGPPGELRADRIKVRQALRNLVANALDVLPDGGKVRVTVESDGRSVTFQVHDSGPGVAPEDHHRLCDPFFTTRADGTGLGLALVLRVAELHGGTFDLQPEPSPLGGATFALKILDQEA